MTGTGPPRVSVVICTYNRVSGLGTVLDDLAGQRGIGELAWEVLVVDNNSSDGTRAEVERWIDRGTLPLRYLFEGVQGKSHALNRGIAEARGSILVFTDDDVRILPEWLVEILRPFEDPACMGVAGAVEPDWPARPPRWVSAEPPYRMMAAIVQYSQPAAGTTRVPPIGANAAWRREVFERHGGFRSELGPAGAGSPLGEDTELGLRMIAAGEEVRFAPAARIRHPVAEERLTRRYFLAWYYDSGRFEPFRPGRPQVVMVGGVPRYLYRELLSVGLKWVTAIDPRRRFFYKLRTWQTIGSIRAFRALARGG
jgi:glycosyltransferase involved in cell wall biosynthesis